MNFRKEDKYLGLLKQIEDGYNVDYLACLECAEGGCDIDCECVCHDSADEKKRQGIDALRKPRHLFEDINVS